MWKRTDHAIYDAFPDGNKVSAASIGVDWKQGIQVLDSERDMCWRQLKKDKTWIIQHYLSVQFEQVQPDGSTGYYWTTFSRDVDQWMWLWAEYEEQQA